MPNSSTPAVPVDGHLTASDLAARPLGGMRVLVLEPDPDAAASLAAVLRLNGFDADEAYTGAAALRIVSSRRPCAVLMDVALADVDPWKLIRQLRATPQPPVVIVVTGDTSTAHRTAAAAAGAADYLLKPADPLTLIALIHRLCSSG